MAIPFTTLIINFVISLLVSAIIIYFVVKLFGEKDEGIGTAIMAALIGSIIYVVAHFLLGNSWLAAIVGGIAWLLALGNLYKIGWVKAALIALIVWIIVSVLSFLPTLRGPL